LYMCMYMSMYMSVHVYVNMSDFVRGAPRPPVARPDLLGPDRAVR